MPGLGYALAVNGFAPWGKTPAPGLELAIATSGDTRVGRASHPARRPPRP